MTPIELVVGQLERYVESIDGERDDHARRFRQRSRSRDSAERIKKDFEALG